MSRARDFADLAGSADAGGLTGRNLIINGAMQVAQRGTSSTTSGIRTVDRTSNTFGTVAVTQTQDTTVPSGEGFSNSFKNECTSASSDAGAFFGIQQIVEAQDLRNSGWDYTSPNSYITLSFWARSSVAGTYMCGLRTSDGTAYNISSQYTLVADTWKRVEASFPGNSNLTIDNDNGPGMTVFPVLELGSNYTAGSSFDVWTAHSGTTQSPDANILFHDTANATFFVTGIQLEVGQQATPFEHRSFQDEYLRCCRYFYRLESTKGYTSFCLARNWSTTNASGNLYYYTPMRVSPTFTSSTVNSSNFDYSLSSLSLATNPPDVPNGVSHAPLNLVGSFTNGGASHVAAANTTNEIFVAFDAEL